MTTMTVENPADWDVQTETITKVEPDTDGWWVTADWAYFVEKQYGVEPKVGDEITFFTRQLSLIEGIAINGKVLFYNDKRKSYRDRQKWLSEYRSKNHIRFLENADAWFEKVDNYKNKEFTDRVHRFEDEDGEEDFWSDGAAYELAILDAADYITELARERNPDNPVEWLDWWWSLNTKEHDYDLARQKQEAPGFGDGHSGNTAAAAYALSKRVLLGLDI